MKAYIDDTKQKVIEAALVNNIPLMLVGETGVGKTTIVAVVAEANKKELVRISINGNTSTEEILGKFLLHDGVTKWVDGALIDAMRHGKWVVMDEINAAAPDVLFALHGILDHEKAIVLAEKDNERVVAHEDFRLVTTMNPDSYVGTKNMSQAFMSRFIVEFIKILPPSQEIELLKIKLGLDETIATQLVQIGAALRKMKDEQRIEYFCSTRDLELAGSLIKGGVPIGNAITVAILNKMNELELDEVRATSKDIAGLVRVGTAEVAKAEEATKKVAAAEQRLHEIQKTVEMHKKDIAELEAKKVEGLRESEKVKVDLLKLRAEASEWGAKVEELRNIEIKTSDGKTLKVRL